MNDLCTTFSKWYLEYEFKIHFYLQNIACCCWQCCCCGPFVILDNPFPSLFLVSFCRKALAKRKTSFFVWIFLLVFIDIVGRNGWLQILIYFIWKKKWDQLFFLNGFGPHTTPCTISYRELKFQSLSTFVIDVLVSFLFVRVWVCMFFFSFFSRWMDINSNHTDLSSSCFFFFSFNLPFYFVISSSTNQSTTIINRLRIHTHTHTPCPW